MDELGVFVKSYGIKPQGKSSPMSSSKSTSNNKPINPDPSSFGPINHDYLFAFNSPTTTTTTTNTSHTFPTSDVFKNGNFSGGSGVGGGGFDIESMFKGSMNLNSNGSGGGDDGDLIWGFSGNVVSGSSDDLLSYDPVDHFFGNFRSNPSTSNVVNDLLPGFGVSSAQFHRAQAGSREKSAGSSSLEELEDFVTGGAKKASRGQLHGFTAPKEAKQTGSSLDELEDFVTGGTKKAAKGQLHGFPAPKEAKQTGSSLDELEDFVTGGAQKTSKGHLHGFPAPKEAKQTGSSLDELEDFVTGGAKKTVKGHLNGFSATKEAKQSSSSLDDFDDFVTGGMKKTDKGHLSGNSSKKQAKKTVSQKSQQANFIDIDGSFNDDSVHKDKVENVSDLLFPEEATDLDTFFGAHTKKSVPVTEDMSMNTQTDGVPDMFSETPFRMEKTVPPSGLPDDFSSIFDGTSTSAVFEEIEGESEERRRARLGRHQRASARMAQALAEMNEREYQAQQEREEKHRLADAMDVEMKQWAAGKEGNLRALLSSLQLVLAPELGWRPVTLTDLITSSQVKIAYKKAALCVHPDKVQQKGASLQQKFVAEKVFDLLKEAWNKFNAEELR